MQAPRQTNNNAVHTGPAGNARQLPGFVDNRPTAVAFRALTEMLTNSPRVLQQRALGDALHTSARMVAQRHALQALFGGAVRTHGDGAGPAGLSLAQRDTPGMRQCAQTQPVLQCANIIPGKFSEAYTGLQNLPAFAKLEAAALENAGGDIKIIPSKDDDTRWERKYKTIYISTKKKKNEVASALLFELHNAANAHTFTNAIEARMVAASEFRRELKPMDYIKVAQEMERDEFESLKSYKEMVEADGGRGKNRAFTEKYVHLLGEDGEIDYKLFVAQNFSSGHTLELAKLQYAAYTKKNPDDLEQMLPSEIMRPTASASASASGGRSARIRSKVNKNLENEKANDAHATSDFLWALDAAENGETRAGSAAASSSAAATSSRNDDMSDSGVKPSSYQEWLQEVAAIVLQTQGVALQDLPDAPFALAYEDDYSPTDFCEEYFSDEALGFS